MTEPSLGSTEVTKCAIRCYCDSRATPKEARECNQVFENLEDRLTKGNVKFDKRLLSKTADAIDDRNINAREKGYDKNPINTFLNGVEVEYEYVPQDTGFALIEALGDAYTFLASKLHEEHFDIRKTTRKTMDIINLDDGTVSTYRIHDLLKRYEAPNEMFKILTSLPSKKPRELVLEITTKPEDILLKSTCQNWTSCENLVEGEYSAGPFSDVTNWNGMAVVREQGKPREKWYGRQMLRWCIDDHGNKNIGVEPRFYGEESFESATMDALNNLLDKHGLGEFKYCATPYHYAGYSDTSRRSDDIIIYGDKKEYRKDIIVRLVDTFINSQMDERRAINCRVRDSNGRRPIVDLSYVGTIGDYLRQFTTGEGPFESSIKEHIYELLKNYGVNEERDPSAFVASYSDGDHFNDRFLTQFIDYIRIFDKITRGESPSASCEVLSKEYARLEDVRSAPEVGMMGAPVVVVDSMDEFQKNLEYAQYLNIWQDAIDEMAFIDDYTNYYYYPEEKKEHIQEMTVVAKTMAENYLYDFGVRHHLNEMKKFEDKVELDEERMFDEAMFVSNMARYLTTSMRNRDMKDGRFEKWIDVMDAVRIKLENGEEIDMNVARNYAYDAYELASKNHSEPADIRMDQLKDYVSNPTAWNGRTLTPEDNERFMRTIDDLLHNP